LRSRVSGEREAKKFGDPKSPSYFGISYSRMRWVAPGVPGELGDEPVILVPVLAEMREHESGENSCLTASNSSLTELPA